MVQISLDFFAGAEVPVEEKEEKKTEECYEDYIVMDDIYIPMRCDEDIREVGYYSCFHEMVKNLVPTLVPTEKTNKKGEVKPLAEGIQKKIASQIEAKILKKFRNPTRLYLAYKGHWDNEDLDLFEEHGVKVERR